MNKSISFFFLVFYILTQHVSDTSIVSRFKRQAQTVDTLSVVPDIFPKKAEYDFTVDKLTLIAEINFGPSPVLNANVNVTLDPGNNNEFSILLANVDFNPGIYSAVINFCTQPGRHTVSYVTETVEDTCKMTTNGCEKLPIGIRDQKTYGSITIKSCGINGQLIGPGTKILQARYIRANSKLSITWTEGWEKNTISAYDLYYLPQSSNINDIQLWVDQGTVIASLMPPESISTSRTAEFDLFGVNGEINVAIIAVSLIGNSSRGLSSVYPVYINDITESTVIPTDAISPKTTTVIDKVTTATDEITQVVVTLTDAITTSESTNIDDLTTTPTIQPNSTNADSSASGPNALVIVGAVILCLLVAGGIGALIYIMKCYKASFVGIN